MNGFYAFLAVLIIVVGVLFGINMVQNNQSTSRETNLNISVPQTAPNTPKETPAVEMPAASAPTTSTETSQ